MAMRPGLPDSVESVPSSGRNVCRNLVFDFVYFVTQPVILAQ